MRSLRKREITFACFLILSFGVVITALSYEQPQQLPVELPVAHTAVISWLTDKPSTSQVEYGTDATYGTITEEDNTYTTHHRITLFDLPAATEIHYRVIGQDTFGNKAVSPDFTFKTPGKTLASVPPKIFDVAATTVLTAQSQEGTDNHIRAARLSDREAAAIIATGPDVPLAKNPQKQIDILTPSDEGIAQKSTQLVKKEGTIKKALMQKGGILLKKGKWQIDPSMTYVHTSANRITVEGFTILPVLIIGEISTEKVKRDILIENVSARYGLKDDLQLEVSVPYRYQHDRISVETPASDTNRSSNGIGDISTGLFYQFAYEDGGMPDMIAGVSVKSNTGVEPYGRDIGLGTGHWGVKSSLVAVKSSDPAILFGSLGYTHNIERDDVTDYGTIKPGDTFDYSLGAAFALNYQVALSAQLQQSITEKMLLNHASVPGSFTNVASFKYGITWAIDKNKSCEISAAHGLTTDSPDLMLEISFPFTF
ncbi:transporter [Candidatus Omnitrophota bacterium]